MIVTIILCTAAILAAMCVATIKIVSALDANWDRLNEMDKMVAEIAGHTAYIEPDGQRRTPNGPDAPRYG